MSESTTTTKDCAYLIVDDFYSLSLLYQLFSTYMLRLKAIDTHIVRVTCRMGTRWFTSNLQQGRCLVFGNWPIYASDRESLVARALPGITDYFA